MTKHDDDLARSATREIRDRQPAAVTDAGSQKDSAGTPRIICLCGSSRFIEQFAIKTWELELEGSIVLGCTLLPHWYCGVRDHFAEKIGVKVQRDEHHLRKIDLADEVLVLNIGGYIGESTRNEIDYATAHGKPVKYLEATEPQLALPAHQERTEPQWRCFHCDEVFTDKAEAREHFGELMDDDPLCQIKADEGGLAGEIRRLEAEVLRICHERNESENDARLWHESEADRVRRIGNHQWWFHLDCLEGEKLVLQERIAELEKLVAVPARAHHQQDEDTKDVMARSGTPEIRDRQPAAVPDAGSE